jgi:hypothetical protein
VLAHLGHGISATLDDINNAIWDTRFLEKVDQNFCSERNLLARFHNIGVSKGNTKREHPKGDHGREVVRANTTHNTEGLTERVNIYTTGNTLNGLTLAKGGEGASVLNDFVAAENITSSVGERLSVLLGDGSGELVLVIFKKLLVLEHVANPGGDGDLLPGFESVSCVGDSLIKF